MAAVPAAEPFCYLTTTGRRSGRPHRIEIWFVSEDWRTLYLMAGGGERADWVQNLVSDPNVTVEVAGVSYGARARVVDTENDEDSLARRLMLAKYQQPGADDLDSWGVSAMVVALAVAE